MSRREPGEDAWERVADEAASLFLRSGYAAVSLRKIGDALGMKPASLYYHCPGGKAELYFRSLHHVLEGYRAALDSVASSSAYPACILEMAMWMLEHPPVDFRRIMEIDLPALAKADAALAEQIPMLLHGAVFEPIREAFAAGAKQGQLPASVDLDVAAAATIALVEGLGYMHAPAQGGAPDPVTVSLVRGGLELLLRGVATAEEGGGSASSTSAAGA